MWSEQSQSQQRVNELESK